MKDQNSSKIQWVLLIIGVIFILSQILSVIPNINENNEYDYDLLKIIIGFIFFIGIIFQSIRTWLAREIATIIFMIVLFGYISIINFNHLKVTQIIIILVNLYMIIENIKEFRKSKWFSMLRYKYLLGVRTENSIEQYYDWLFYKRKYEMIININNRSIANNSIYFYVGASNILLGKNEEGIKYLIKIEDDPKYKNKIKYLIGISMYNQNLFEEAIGKFNSYLTSEPENYDVINCSAISKLKVGKYKEAIEDYTKLIACKQNICENLYNRSICKYNLGKIDEAELDLKEATKQKHPIAEVYLKFAEIKIEKNEIDVAIEYYNKAIKIDKKLKKDLEPIIKNLIRNKGEKTT